MARKILSFEEYAKKITAPDVSEEETDEVATEDRAEEIEDDGIEMANEEDHEDEEESEESDEDEDDEDEDEDDEDEDEDEDEESEEEPVEVKPASEMLKEVYESACNEAMAYEGDDYQEHTVESYMKEMAALNAGMMAEMYEAACKEAKEGEMTVEMYEGACNEMKEAYAKKMDEMMEAYGGSEN